jgi:hypothetical protein
MWQRYYQKWKEATREHLDPTLLELLPSLAELCPPAIVVDKTRAIRGEAGPSRDGTQRWQAATNQLPKNVYKPPGTRKVVDGDGTKTTMVSPIRGCDELSADCNDAAAFVATRDISRSGQRVLPNRLRAYATRPIYAWKFHHDSRGLGHSLGGFGEAPERGAASCGTG